MDSGIGRLLRLDGEKLRNCDPGFPLDAERDAESADGKPVNTTDFAEGHDYSPLNEFCPWKCSYHAFTGKPEIPANEQ